MEQLLNQIIKEILPYISTPEGLIAISAGTLGSIKITRKYLQQNIRKKLIKKNVVKNYKMIMYKPSILHIEEKPSNIENYPHINELVTNFKNTLEKNLTEEQMTNVRKSLKNLQYRPLNFYQIIKDTHHGVGGSYSEHYITNNPLSTMKIEHILYHELLHASTSSLTKYSYHIGFAQYNNARKNLGIFINEGYTELLTRRNFGEDKNVGYNYELSVAEIIELIIGKEKMQDLYFKLDLNGLINELGKYSDINKTKQFLLNLDTIMQISRHKKNDDLKHILATLYNKISSFLYETFQNKTNQYLDNKKINQYFEESEKFQQLILEVEKNNRFHSAAKEKNTLRNYILNISHNINMSQSQTKMNKKTKKLVNSKNKGFINILTISTLLTIISFLSIGVSYLLLQAR